MKLSQFKALTEERLKLLKEIDLILDIDPYLLTDLQKEVFEQTKDTTLSEEAKTALKETLLSKDKREILAQKRARIEEIKKEIPKINKELTDDKTIDNILISNISLVSKNNKTTFSAKITNLTANELKYTNLTITIKDKNNKELATLITYFGGLLAPEETKIVTAETNKNLTNAASLEYNLR